MRSALRLDWTVRLGLVVVLGLAADAYAQQLYVYPAKGQSKDQQNNDEAACYRFGRDQSGFDPMQAPTATSPEPQTKGGAGSGLFKGALLGLAVGAIAGDAGKGAAIGAVGGGMFGGMRRHGSRVDQQQWADQQSASYAANRNNYNRAYSACLQGRGYTVN